MRTSGLAAAAMIAAALVGCRGASPAEERGGVVVRVSAITSAGEITRVELEVQPAGVRQDLTYDAASGGFAGAIALPIGPQTFTVRAFAGPRLVGTGSATAEIAAGVTTAVQLTILDQTGADPQVDHAPILASLVASPTVARPGQAVTLAADARDPDGDPVAYAWTQSCTAGAFADPASPATTWSSGAEGTCLLTITASARGLTAAAAIQITVRDATGIADVSGVFVPNPRATAMTAVIGGAAVTRARSDVDVLAGTVPAGAAVDLRLDYDLGTTTAGAVRVAAADDCGGAATTIWTGTSQAGLIWSPPARPGLCVVRATVTHAGLSDGMMLAFLVDATAGAVTGTRLVTYWDAGQRIELPEPFPSDLVAYPQLSDGSWGAPISVWVQPGGSFTVPGVAPGARYLLGATDEFGLARWVDTSAVQLDLGRDEIGRPDKALATAPTPLQFFLGGLAPFLPADELQLTSDGADVWEVPSYGWALAEGAQSVDGETMDLLDTPFGRAAHLADAGRGDRTFVHQLASAPFAEDPLATLRVATRFAEVPLSVADGIGATIQAFLQPVPQTGRLVTQWQASAFEAAVAAVHPTAEPFGHYLYVDAAPGPLEHGGPVTTAGTPDLLFLERPVPAGDLPLSLEYGRFLPPHWSEFLNVALHSRVRVQAPGATSSRTVTLFMTSSIPAPFGPVLAPQVTPVLELDLEGAPATVDRAGVGTTPLLSWSPPAVGAPDRYQVVLQEVAVSATGGTTILRHGTFQTRSTSLRFPPGVLQPGRTYFARVAAFVEPGSDVETRPFRGGYRWARAEAVTSLFTP